MTTPEQSIKLAGVRFARVGKIYHFDAASLDDLRIGDWVVVETSRGWQIGQVASFVSEPGQPPEGGWKAINRRATPVDLMARQQNEQKEAEALNAARIRARELRLEGVKIVAAEYTLDGLRLAVLFSTETEERVDLKSLRQDIQRQFMPAQVELRQIGPRDVAKYIGGMGACGLECRCCSCYLTEFSSISIRMAKEQGISLTPAEITGMCGRLRCCLIYEYQHYVEARTQLPKRNKRVITPNGEAKVVDVFPLRQAVLVEFADGSIKEFTKEEINPAEELEALQRKAQNPCPNGDDGSKQDSKDE